MTPIDIAYREYGYAGVVEFLNNNPDTVANQVLSLAAAKDDRTTVEFVLPHSDPKHEHSLPLRRAVNNGHHNMVEFLIPHSDPMAMKCSSLLRAVERHDLKMVGLLLPHSDPKMRRSEFLQRCIYHDLQDIAQLLWPLSNIEAVRRIFVQHDDEHHRLQLHKMELWEAQFQNIRLHNQIQYASNSVVRKSKL